MPRKERKVKEKLRTTNKAESNENVLHVQQDESALTFFMFRFVRARKQLKSAKRRTREIISLLVAYHFILAIEIIMAQSTFPSFVCLAVSRKINKHR